MYLLSLSHSSSTNYVITRLGNVWESSGSVVRLFKDQIKKGEAVKVTSRDMKRYFITPFEAVRLMLNASTIGKSGEIFTSDMGTPVSIVELAKRLIDSYSNGVSKKVEIQFTGVREGEKLCEELKYEFESRFPSEGKKLLDYVVLKLIICMY